MHCLGRQLSKVLILAVFWPNWFWSARRAVFKRRRRAGTGKAVVTFVGRVLGGSEDPSMQRIGTEVNGITRLLCNSCVCFCRHSAASSKHPNIVIAAFADGYVRKVRKQEVEGAFWLTLREREANGTR